MKVPLCVADITDAEKQAVMDVLESGWLAPGNYNKDFERRFADYIGVKHALALNSCTSALHLAVQLNNITGEVLVPSFTFVASANSIVTAGATPVFVDIEPDTRTMDVSKLESKISERTEAIMPVHFGGHPADMKGIMEIAGKHGLVVIEDSAETLGAMHGEKMAGAYGVGCFSFFPTKNITTAEGGMLTTNDDDLAKKVKAYAGHGILSSTHEREKKEMPWLRAASFPGYNFRLSNVHAALGAKQMERIDDMNARRVLASDHLTSELERLDEVSCPIVREGCTHVYQMYTILLDPKVDRTSFVRYLNENGVGASVHFDPPVHEQPFYERGFDTSDLEVTEDVAKRIVTLPMFPGLTNEQMDYMVSKVKQGIKNS